MATDFKDRLKALNKEQLIGLFLHEIKGYAEDEGRSAYIKMPSNLFKLCEKAQKYYEQHELVKDEKYYYLVRKKSEVKEMIAHWKKGIKELSNIEHEFKWQSIDLKKYKEWLKEEEDLK